MSLRALVKRATLTTLGLFGACCALLGVLLAAGGRDDDGLVGAFIGGLGAACALICYVLMDPPAAPDADVRDLPGAEKDEDA